MMQKRFLKNSFVFTLLVVLIGATPALAQSHTKNGILKIHVAPKQAYVFVDGEAIRDGSQSIALNPGRHTVEVRNYGYVPSLRTLKLRAEKRRKCLSLSRLGRQGGRALR